MAEEVGVILREISPFGGSLAHGDERFGLIRVFDRLSEASVRLRESLRGGNEYELGVAGSEEVDGENGDPFSAASNLEGGSGNPGKTSVSSDSNNNHA